LNGDTTLVQEIESSNLGIAYVFYKALTPVRMPIGIALVPLIAKITGTKAAEVSESTGQE